MNKSKGYLYYLLWMIGALLLLYYGNKFLTFMDSKVNEFYKMEYSLIGNIAYAFVIGIYLSLLNGLPGRRKFFRPLFFFVFIPSFILMIYPILGIYFEVPNFSQYLDLVILHEGYFFFTMLCGLSFMKSLFGSR
ncbi:hypothetical protein D3C76_309610 [compost metagenome]